MSESERTDRCRESIRAYQSDHFNLHPSALHKRQTAKRSVRNTERKTLSEKKERRVSEGKTEGGWSGRVAARPQAPESFEMFRMAPFV